MIVTHLGRGFGDDTSTTPDPQSNPAMSDILTILSDAETSLYRAFNRLKQVQANAPSASIDRAILQGYNDAHDAFVAAAEVWRQARLATPTDQLPDPNALPTYPPKLDVPAAGFGAAWGANDQVPLSMLTATFGPAGRETRAGLGALPFMGVNRHGQAGLGALPLWGILLLVAIIGTTVALAAKSIGDSVSSVSASRASAEEARARAQMTDRAMDAIATMVVPCAQVAKTAEEVQQCITKATAAAKDVIDATKNDRAAIPPSVFAVIGAIVVAGAVGFGGYFVYKRVTDTKGHHRRLKA